MLPFLPKRQLILPERPALPPCSLPKMLKIFNGCETTVIKDETVPEIQVHATYWQQQVPSTVQHKSAGQLVPVLPVWQVSAISTGVLTQPRSHGHTLEFGSEVFFPTR